LWLIAVAEVARAYGLGRQFNNAMLGQTGSSDKVEHAAERIRGLQS